MLVLVMIIHCNSWFNVIDAGAGNDTIALGSGADDIDGGAGNDIITAAAALGNTDIIDGGAGTDTLTTTAAVSSATMGGVSNRNN